MNLSLKRGGLDVTFSVTMLVVVVLAIGLMLDPRPVETVAHLWGRWLGPGQESACPTAFGNAFWFACASEVRSLS
jgi:hypothetical protein